MEPRVVTGFTPEARAALAKERGDALWYLSEHATATGHAMADDAIGNVEKLAGRAARGTLHGEGDNR